MKKQSRPIVLYIIFRFPMDERPTMAMVTKLPQQGDKHLAYEVYDYPARCKYWVPVEYVIKETCADRPW